MSRANPLPRPVLAVAVALCATGAAPLRALDAPPPPPDLRLEWQGAPSLAEPVRGRAGEVVSLAYLLRNVGGSDAFAAVLEARTALGRAEGPSRIQPGPAAGGTLRRSLHLRLARGMSEVCLEVWLQTIEASEPGDPHPEDNRICRRLEVEAGAELGAPRAVRREPRS